MCFVVEPTLNTVQAIDEHDCDDPALLQAQELLAKMDTEDEFWKHKALLYLLHLESFLKKQDSLLYLNILQLVPQSRTSLPIPDPRKTKLSKKKSWETRPLLHQNIVYIKSQKAPLKTI